MSELSIIIFEKESFFSPPALIEDLNVEQWAQLERDLTFTALIYLFIYLLWFAFYNYYKYKKKKCRSKNGEMNNMQ